MNMHHTITRYRIIETFTGPFALIETPSGQLSTTWIGIDDAAGALPRGSRDDPSLRAALTARLERYFAGDAVDFDDVPTPKGSPFFERCWNACRSIPRGQTRSYRALAILAGSHPGAARAAGQAMRRNPLAVIVPCHRVVGSDGLLHGYGGSQDHGGPQLAVKRALLTLEGALGDADERCRPTSARSAPRRPSKVPRATIVS